MKAWMSLNFGKFATELRPLIDVRIWFLLNILKTNSLIKTKFCKYGKNPLKIFFYGTGWQISTNLSM